MRTDQPPANAPSRASERKYPIAPLVTALALPTGASVSRALGISGSRLTTYALCGIDERAAERLAVRAGLVPYEVWPDMLDAAIAELERTCAAPDCDETFVPVDRAPHQRYHHERCKRRMKMRRRRSTPKGREENRQAAARYRTEVAELEAKRGERRAA